LINIKTKDDPKSFVKEKIIMENQDKNTNNPHPKPSDDAQAQVETIIPSTETQESKTTEVKPVKQEDISDKAEDKNNGAASQEKKDEVTDSDDLTDAEDTEANAEEKTDESDEADQIETVAP